MSKRLFKSAAHYAATLLVAPLLLSHFICARLGSRDGSLETHSQALSLLPGLWGSYLRVAFYRQTLDHCDPTATIAFGALLSKAQSSIGSQVYIGPRCMLGWVRLEQDVLLGPAVQIPSGPATHGTEELGVPIRNQAGSPRCVTIGKNSWVGSGSIVMADIGEQSVIGAGSVVTKPIEKQMVAVGSPAKPIRSRSTPSSIASRSQSEISNSASSG